MRGRAPQAALLAIAFILVHAQHAASAATIPITARVAQSGAFAGIRNTLFTTWVPPGQAVASLAGRMTMSGNQPGFSEALVLVGYEDDDRPTCASRNGAVIPGMPAVTRLWAGILKSNDTRAVSIPVSVPLATPILPPHPEAGACLITLISAGYPFLRRGTPLYTTTDAPIIVTTVSAAAAHTAHVTAFGMGGEFKFATDTTAPLFTYIGIRAERPITLEGIAVSISAAPVTNAPPQAGWGAPPAGPWRVDTDFTVIPQAACIAAGFAARRATPDLSILRQSTPVPTPLPSLSAILRHVGLTSRNAEAVQDAFFAPMVGKPAARLDRGDCLLALQSAGPGNVPGRLDVESQSTAYLRPTDSAAAK